jgi:hypothetical protein
MPVVNQKVCFRWRTVLLWASPMRFSTGLPFILSETLPKRLYVIDDKPDISRTPIPRFDLLKSKSMSPWLCSFRVAAHSSATSYPSMAGSPEQVAGSVIG